MKFVEPIDVVIRADSSIPIATGHVYRTLVLAERLRARGVRVAYAVRRFPGDLVDRIAGLGYPVLELGHGDPENRTWLGVPLDEEIAAMRTALEGLSRPPRWVVVDHYELDARWESALRLLGVNVLAIDDLADRPHDCDVLVDPTLGSADRYVGLIPSDARCFLGPAFAFVRDAFTRVRAHSAPRTGGVQSLLLFYGGVDLTGETTKGLRALRDVPGDVRILVTFGAHNPRRPEIEAEAARDPRVVVCAGEDEMAELMAGSDLALGAGGSSNWERCYVGLPTLVTRTADNQNGVVRGLADAGAVVDLGRWTEVDEARLRAAVVAAIANPADLGALSRRAWHLVDGHTEAQAAVLEALTS